MRKVSFNIGNYSIVGNSASVSSFQSNVSRNSPTGSPRVSDDPGTICFVSDHHNGMVDVIRTAGAGREDS